jgi:hypothetical protein
MTNLETIDPGQFNDRWCIAASAGSAPKIWQNYKQCPPLK